MGRSGPHTASWDLAASSVPIGGIRWTHGHLIFVPKDLFTVLMTHCVLILVAFCGYDDIGRMKWVDPKVLNIGTKKEVNGLFIIAIGVSHYLVLVRKLDPFI